MKTGQESRTAMMVTLWRALAHAGKTHVPAFSDPTAAHFLSSGGKKRFERATSDRPGLLGAISVRAADMMALRTLMIDAHLRQAIAHGARQVVILGAGYDGRAYRLDALKGLPVFEVDHPDTQRRKLERARDMQTLAGSLIHVPVNFERDSLSGALSEAGHKTDVPTAWIWEGVVMYLTDSALRETLRTVAARSAAGSTLIVQYNLNEGIHPFGWLLRIWGEPLIGLRSQETMTKELDAVGFRVVDDADAAEWGRRHHSSKPLPKNMGRRTRILAAVR